MSGKVFLKWRYEPGDYLEGGFEEEREGYSLSIGEGNAKAIIDLAFFEEHPQLREQIHDEIRMRLQNAQLLRRRKFDLVDEGMEKVDSDGRRTHYVEAKSTLIIGSIFSGDFQVLDATGKIIHDSKRERLDAQARRAELILKHSGDEVLSAILEIFTTAMNDPDNEFVHLYEIHEALKTRFGKNRRFLTILGIDEETYGERFSALCNHKNIRQGRHRGQGVGKLRDATAAELKEGRDIAMGMIDAYLRYLDKLFPKQSTDDKGV